jgi:transcriptional regulator with GAF, ATPase, and Fis domain
MYHAGIMAKTATLRRSKPGSRVRRRATVTMALRISGPDAPSMRISLDGCTSCEIGRGASLRVIGNRGADRRLELHDRAVSEKHAVLTSSPEGWILRDVGSKNGVYLNGERIVERPLESGDVFAVGGCFLVFREFEGEEVSDLRADDAQTSWSAGMITLQPELEEDLRRLDHVVGTEIPVLVSGLTGTGKELLARAIHARSGRAGELVAVNCAAIPDTLLASELFGVRRGAFSGALADRLGLVRAADRGTLFLDEIAEMSLATQTVLLRVLQEKEVVPIGETRPVAVDVRFVAATHQDLGARVRRGEFREDLYSRLRGFAIELPPLSDRLEDLGLLLAGFVRERRRAVTLTIDAAWQLFRHAWPQNIRQLRHVVLAAIAMGEHTLDVDHLDLPELGATAGSPTPPVTGAGATPRPVPAPQEGIRSYRRRPDPRALRALLEQYGWNVSAVARHLQTSRSQIVRLCERYQIEAPRT